MEDNPYSPPRTLQERFLYQPSFRVDGQYLVVQNGTHLPQRCVLTNETATADDRLTRVFDATQSFKLVIRPQTCLLTYYRKSKPNRPFLRCFGWLLILMLVLISSFFVGNFAIALIPIVLWYRDVGRQSLDPLRVANAKDGQFWISGCCKEFIEFCETEFGTSQKLD